MGVIKSLSIVVGVDMTKVVNKRKESYDVYIGRGSKWGNPFRIGVHGNREEVIEMFREWMLGHIGAPKGFIRPDLDDAKKELKDKVLGCFCKPEDCHGDIYVEFLDDSKNKRN